MMLHVRHELTAPVAALWKRVLSALDQQGSGELHRRRENTTTRGLLGVAAECERSLSWLWECLTPLPPAKSNFPSCSFEHKLPPEVLGERLRQTSIDFYVDDRAALLCIEAKWVERGIGECSCRDSGGNPAEGECSAKVLEREPYWEVARETFRLPDRRVGRPCPLSFTYQAVRNVAAALALARPGQSPVFGLIYDAENPYFAGCGDWPGWPDALRATLEETESVVHFRAVSWQELLPLLPLDKATRQWAAENTGSALSMTLRPFGLASFRRANQLSAAFRSTPLAPPDAERHSSIRAYACAGLEELAPTWVPRTSDVETASAGAAVRETSRTRRSLTR